MRKEIINKLISYNILLNIVAHVYSISSAFLTKGKSGNFFYKKGVFLKNTKIHFFGKNNIVSINKENRLSNCLLHIRGNNCKITIAKHCILNNLELWIEDNGSIINIGEFTTIEGGHIASTEGMSISIGKDCMFSSNIEIRNGDSHSIFDCNSNLRINSASSIIIEDHVWLGIDTKVMKGSQIRRGAIVGSGSIVTGCLESNTIYAGIPTKKIKDNVYWKRER